MAVLNVSFILNQKVKIYAIEKNPYAINTIIDRVKNEWNTEVTLINEDMRTYKPPEKADILNSELLRSIGDNELSPECLDGAQRSLKGTDISIPSSYTSYFSPVNVVHLVNYFEIASPLKLFTFTHPNWSERINNQGCFETTLYKDIDLSIHPETHMSDRVSWFPIYFSLPEPVHMTEGTAIEVSFWR